MKKILIVMPVLLAWSVSLSAQITREQADEIVLNSLSQETQLYTVYAKEGVQTEMTIITAAGEELKLDYRCWVYYVSYTGAGRYLIVNESNGNLLEVNAKSGAEPDGLAEWRIIPIDIPFTEYLLNETSCQWIYLGFHPNGGDIIVINSNEEFVQYAHYITCTDYPKIDFSEYTLLLTYGSSTQQPAQLINANFSKDNMYEYTLNLTIFKGFLAAPSVWHFAFLVPKISGEERVILNVSY